MPSLHPPVELERGRGGDGDFGRATRDEELGQQQSGGSGSEDQGGAAGSDLEGFQAVHGAGGGFGGYGGVVVEPLDGVGVGGGCGEVLRAKPPGQLGADALEVAAQQRLAAAAGMAVAAADVGVARHPFPYLEAGDAVADGGDRADDLVAGDEGERRVEVALDGCGGRCADAAVWMTLISTPPGPPASVQRSR